MDDLLGIFKMRSQRVLYAKAIVLHDEARAGINYNLDCGESATIQMF